MGSKGKLNIEPVYVDKKDQATGINEASTQIMLDSLGDFKSKMPGIGSKRNQ